MWAHPNWNHCSNHPEVYQLPLQYVIPCIMFVATTFDVGHGAKPWENEERNVSAAEKWV